MRDVLFYNTNKICSLPPDPHFITTVNGTILLIINKYSYHKIAGVKYDGGIRWQCSQRKKMKCKAFVVTSEDEQTIFRIRGFHNHDHPVFKETSAGFYRV